MGRFPQLNRTPVPEINLCTSLLPELHQRTLTASRIKVPGGWIVVASTLLTVPEFKGEEEYDVTSLSTSAVFVADPEHKWLGDDLPEEERDAQPR